MVSVFLASVFVKSQTSFKNTIFTLFLILILVLLSINILYALFILSEPILVLGILFSVVLLLAYFLKVFKNVSVEILIANAFLLFIFNVFVVMYPLLMPNPGKQLVENLQKSGATKNHSIYVYGNIRAASNIRIHSHNEFNVISMDTVFTLPETEFHFLVFDKKEMSLLNLTNYEVLTGSEEWLRVQTEEFPPFLQKTVSSVKKNGTKYLIAKPSN